MLIPNYRDSGVWVVDATMRLEVLDPSYSECCVVCINVRLSVIYHFFTCRKLSC